MALSLLMRTASQPWRPDFTLFSAQFKVLLSQLISKIVMQKCMSWLFTLITSEPVSHWSETRRLIWSWRRLDWEVGEGAKERPLCRMFGGLDSTARARRLLPPHLLTCSTGASTPRCALLSISQISLGGGELDFSLSPFWFLSRAGLKVVGWLNLNGN